MRNERMTMENKEKTSAVPREYCGKWKEKAWRMTRRLEVQMKSKFETVANVIVIVVAVVLVIAALKPEAHVQVEPS